MATLILRGNRNGKPAQEEFTDTSGTMHRLYRTGESYLIFKGPVGGPASESLQSPTRAEQTWSALKTWHNVT